MPSRRERGFRRLTLCISLLALCAGLALTVHQVYRTRLFVVAQGDWRECIRAIAPPPAPLVKQQEAAERCREHIEDVRFPSIPSAGVRFVLNTVNAFPAVDPSVLDWIMDHFNTVTVALSLIVTGLLVALPWAVYYIARWIARGFDAPA